MKRLTWTLFSIFITRHVSAFPFFLGHYRQEFPNTSMMSTKGVGKVTKRAATSILKKDHSVKKRLSAQRDDEIILREERNSILPTTCSTSIPWYTIFTKDDAEYNEYMATEWGFERRGDQVLFEKLSLEGAQSGLSWLTILRKREAYRRAFQNFDPMKVSLMTDEDVQRLLTMECPNSRDQLVRHRGKIESVINNAKCIVQLQTKESSPTHNDSFGVFDDLIWSFVNHKPILNRYALSQQPTKSQESEAMSKELKKRGFKFVGPTTCYSMMQALGMIIDHPLESPEWLAAYERLKKRPGGFQERTTPLN